MTPPEWISARLSDLQTLLVRRTEQAAQVLRQLLGPIGLGPIEPDEGHRSEPRSL